MVTDVKPLQPEKAPLLIDVTLSGMVTDVKPLQPEKAPLLIDVTLFGMVTEVSPLQYSKADSPMDVTLLGIIVFEHPFIKVLVAVSIMALQLSRESYFGLPLSTLIDVKPLQPKKALSPMDVTLLGMVRDVRPLQPEYLQLIVYQYISIKTVEK